jgi:hypothetical protein
MEKAAKNEAPKEFSKDVSFFTNNYFEVMPLILAGLVDIDKTS